MLDMMEKCVEYNFKNSLNMFSMTFGPFEKPVQEVAITTLEDKKDEKKPDVDPGASKDHVDT